MQGGCFVTVCQCFYSQILTLFLFSSRFNSENIVTRYVAHSFCSFFELFIFCVLKRNYVIGIGCLLCCGSGSGSLESISFWASPIRIRHYLYRSRLVLVRLQLAVLATIQSVHCVVHRGTAKSLEYADPET
jgi:hypothetical protein